MKKYRARYNGETPDSMAPLAYDATFIVAEAITRAGTTEGPKLRDALAATKTSRCYRPHLYRRPTQRHKIRRDDHRAKR